MAWKPFVPNCFWIACAGLLLAGCQEQEQIHEYTVPKEPPPRLLAVMVPRANVTWFFKLMGPAPEVAKHVQAFDAFVASVRFPDPGKGSIVWTVPDDWDEEHSDERFYAVLRFAGNGVPLPITVTPLGGPQARNVRANLDRWRVNQLGLDKISDAELKKLDGNIRVDGVKATRVDFTGLGSGKGRRRIAVAPPAPRAAVLHLHQARRLGGSARRSGGRHPTRGCLSRRIGKIHRENDRAAPERRWRRGAGERQSLARRIGTRPG